MRKVLLGTTALVVAGAFAGIGVAQADDEMMAEPISDQRRRLLHRRHHQCRHRRQQPRSRHPAEQRVQHRRLDHARQRHHRRRPCAAYHERLRALR